MQVRTGDFFFPFFPPSSCAPLPAPDNPRTSLRTLTPGIESAHAVASLDEHRPPHPPQSHSCRCLYATLMPLCMPALKPCTCTTHLACGLAFLWGLKPVSPLYFFFTFTFFLLYFFFFSVLCVCTPFQHTSEHHPCTPPPLSGQKAKQQHYCKVSMMATTCTHPLPMSHVPPTVSIHSLQLAHNRLPSLTHKEITGIELAAA